MDEHERPLLGHPDFFVFCAYSMDCTARSASVTSLFAISSLIRARWRFLSVRDAGPRRLSTRHAISISFASAISQDHWAS
jgi:hypothetical protein